MSERPSSLRLPALALALAVLCAGCGTTRLFGEQTGRFEQSNYVSIQHSFTDAGAEKARRQAVDVCTNARRVAVRTGGTCSLKQCVTYYQCMTKEDAQAFQSDDGRK